VKAQLPAGTVAVDATALVGAIVASQQQGATQRDGGNALPVPAGWATTPFAPGMPLAPRPINDPDPLSGEVAPRRYDYPVSFNLPGVDQRVLPWKVLRDAADQIDLFRLALEVRKSDIRALDWGIGICDEALEMAKAKDSSATDADISEKLRDQFAEDIARVREFWKVPDRTNGIDFAGWINQLLEEHFVLDAVAIYPRKTRGGDLYALEVIDGTTIKPLLDERGNTPFPPSPAYQQVLVGFPRGEFTADVDTDSQGEDGMQVIPNGLTRSELIYERWNVRTHTPYGFSIVEQALVTADLWLKRQEWFRAEFTDGVLPAGWMETDGSYTPAQLREYNAVFNDYLSGNTRERQRIQALPKGFKPVVGDGAPGDRFDPRLDEFLLKLVLAHLKVLPSRVGITPNSGLGGKGHQDGEEDSQMRQATRPTIEWLAHLFTRISRTHLGMPAELEFKFLGLDAEDEAAADTLEENRLRSGRMTLNETRDAIGKPRFDFPEADMPMVMGRTGVIFLEGQLNQKEAALEAFGVGANTAIPEPGQAAPATGEPGQPETPENGPVAPTSATDAGSGSKDTTPAKTGQQAADSAAKAEELSALRRFARKGNRSRPFVVKHLTPDEVALLGLDVAVVHELGKGDASREGLAGVGDARRADRSAHPGRRSGFTWADPEPA
jgi:hypothetical protein